MWKKLYNGLSLNGAVWWRKRLEYLLVLFSWIGTMACCVALFVFSGIRSNSTILGNSRVLHYVCRISDYVCCRGVLALVVFSGINSNATILGNSGVLCSGLCIDALAC